MTEQTTTKEWATKPEDANIIDDSFWIRKQRWGTFISVDKDDNNILTSLTEEQCLQSTRWYLKAKQEGFLATNTYEGEVGGKL